MKKNTTTTSRKSSAVTVSRNESLGTNWIPAVAVTLAGIICFVAITLLSRVPVLDSM